MINWILEYFKIELIPVKEKCKVYQVCSTLNARDTRKEKYRIWEKSDELWDLGGLEGTLKVVESWCLTLFYHKNTKSCLYFYMSSDGKLSTSQSKLFHLWTVPRTGKPFRLLSS